VVSAGFSSHIQSEFGIFQSLQHIQSLSVFPILQHCPSASVDIHSAHLQIWQYNREYQQLAPLDRSLSDLLAFLQYHTRDQEVSHVYRCQSGYCVQNLSNGKVSFCL